MSTTRINECPVPSRRVLGYAFAILLALISSTLWGQTPAAATDPVQALAQRLVNAPSDQAVEEILTSVSSSVNEALFAACRTSAQALLDRRQFPQALRGFQSALIVAKRLSSPGDAGVSYRGIGLSYRGLGQTTLALTNYDLGLAAATEAKDKALMAALLRGLGVAKRNLGRMDDAIPDDERSVALYRELNDQRETAAGLSNLALNYEWKGDLRHGGEILEEARRAGSAFPEIVIAVTNNLGNIAGEQGNLLAARDLFEDALHRAEQQNAKSSELVALEDVGIIYRELGEVEKAIATHDRSLALARELKNRRIEATALLNRAAAYERQGHRDLAIADLKQSLQILEQIDAPENVAYTLVPLARLQNTCGDGGETVPEAERALSIGHQIQSHEVQWQALLVLGECRLARNEPSQARQAFEQAVQEVELLRDLAGGDEQTAFLDDKIEPFHALVGALLRDGQPEAALQTAERAKARQLLDTMRMGKAEPAMSETPEERAEEQRLGEALIRLDRRLAGQQTDDQRKAAQGEWDKAQLQLVSFREHLYNAHPGLAARRGDAVPVRLADTADLLPNDRTALVEFTSAEGALYVFAITRGGDGKPALTVRTVKDTRADLAREVSAFREQLAARSLGYRANATALYNKLLGPIAPQLRGKDTLVLVPDGPLWELPFQALIRPDGAHVIERQTVFYAPSLTYLRESRGRRPQTHAAKQLFAVGNPGSANLPNAAREVQGLAKVYGADSARTLTGAGATKQAWLENASQYRVLHLATHGVLNSTNPMYSWLSLAPAKPGTSDDALEAREVIGMNLHADIAVLSACDTARGEVSSGEGMVGMSWAFLMAGVSTTVVSQWSVDSASTTQLMLAFHGNLKPALDSGLGKARALRNAAVAVMRDSEHRHPYYWAGFVLVGDGY